jgi:hypothetical protein
MIPNPAIKPPNRGASMANVRPPFTVDPKQTSRHNLYSLYGRGRDGQHPAFTIRRAHKPLNERPIPGYVPLIHRF